MHTIAEQLTEPAESGYPLELLLGHDRSMLGEDAAEVKDVNNTVYVSAGATFGAARVG